MERTFEIATLFSMSIREAEIAGWTSLAVECAPCGTTTHLSLWWLKKNVMFGYMEEIAQRLTCRTCGGSPTATYLIRPVVKEDVLKKLCFQVQEWSTGAREPIDILAASLNVVVARAAYDEAIHHRPGRPVALCHRARIITSTWGGGPPPTNIVPLEPKKPVDVVPSNKQRKSG